MRLPTYVATFMRSMTKTVNFTNATGKDCELTKGTNRVALHGSSAIPGSGKRKQNESQIKGRPERRQVRLHTKLLYRPYAKECHRSLAQKQSSGGQWRPYRPAAQVFKGDFIQPDQI